MIRVEKTVNKEYLPSLDRKLKHIAWCQATFSFFFFFFFFKDRLISVVDVSFAHDTMPNRLISVVDVSFAHDTMPNRPRHILSYATIPCHARFYFMLTQT